MDEVREELEQLINSELDKLQQTIMAGGRQLPCVPSTPEQMETEHKYWAYVRSTKLVDFTREKLLQKLEKISL